MKLMTRVSILYGISYPVLSRRDNLLLLDTSDMIREEHSFDVCATF
jgi:hypothetical protein